MLSTISVVIQVSIHRKILIIIMILILFIMHFLFVIAILLDVMKTDNWKTMKEENLSVLCDLQQMVLSAAPIV